MIIAQTPPVWWGLGLFGFLRFRSGLGLFLILGLGMPAYACTFGGILVGVNLLIVKIINNQHSFCPIFWRTCFWGTLSGGDG